VKSYVEAFYHGLECKFVMPENRETFMKDLGVRERGEDDYLQWNVWDVINKTPAMLPKDAYCMLTVTMDDLYPYDSWSYCFGWASFVKRTGVFSF
jgi:archaemetzincin